MKILFSFVFFCFYNCIIAQTLVRKIVDKQTGNPLAYATIKILHAPKGVIASDKGEFNLDISSSDSVLFSYIGYQQKILIGLEIKDIIYLDRKVKVLEEVTIGEKKILQTILLGNTDQDLVGEINWGPSNEGKDEFAQKIELPDSTLFYKIKRIFIPVKKSKCFGPLLLHIYGTDGNSDYPAEELLLKLILIANKDIQNEKLIIDVSGDNLFIHKMKFFFISIGWLEGAEYKKCITILSLSKLSTEKTYSRSLYSSSYNWFRFGSMKDVNNNPYEIRTFYSAEVDEMK